MKHQLHKILISIKWFSLMLVVMLASPIMSQAALPLDLATVPLTTTTVDKVKPNMLFVLDDSISMSFEYLPSWTVDTFYGGGDNPNHHGATYHNDASYNALAYDPAVTYRPPAYFDAAGQNTTRYPSQDGTSTGKGANGGSVGNPNWRAVKNNAYDDTKGTNNLESGGPIFQGNEAANPQYTVTIADEYCSGPDLRTCIPQSNPSTDYPYAANIRWCTSAVLADADTTPTSATAGFCQGTRANNFTHMRLPKQVATPNTYIGTVTFSNPYNSPSVLSVVVDGQTITSGSTNTSNNSGALASDLVNRISNCTNAITGTCTIAGYSAIRNGNTVTIYAPNPTTATPNVNTGGGEWVYVRRGWFGGYWRYDDGVVTVAKTAFSQTTSYASPRVTVDITPATTTYPYPGSNVSAATRSDCVTSLCTYAEEMENYANWYTYYRSRMQLMQTSTSLAFESIAEGIRIGFMTINVNPDEIVDFADFTAAQKALWYNELFSIKPEGDDYYTGTPLRRALSRAGRIYANKDDVDDQFSNPIQYECQNNFTLLTTDGEWNTTAGYDLNAAAFTETQDGDVGEKGKYEGATASADTLADVAKYYFDTDLRTTALGNCDGAPVADENGNLVIHNVCETQNTVPALNKVQSMITMTLGLGVDGTLAYDVNYGEDVPGDYKSIYDGDISWPLVTDESTKIDDLWHAGVNGDGRYYSAKKTTELVTQLRDALSRITQNAGAGAALAVNSANLSASSTDYVYLTSFTSSVWSGNLEKREIAVDGTIEGQTRPGNCVENVVPHDSCAQPGVLETDNAGNSSCVTQNTTQDLCSVPLVNGDECRIPVAQVCTGTLQNQATRTIYTNQGNSLTVLNDITDLSVDQQRNFDYNFLKSNLTQADNFDSVQDANLTKEKLLSYILGEKTYEQSAGLSDNRLFRNRSTVLGDVVNAQPTYLAKSNFNYSDAGYQDFKDDQASRSGTIFVGANDGMLHAFNAQTLEERWAFIPTTVIPNLWKLADTDYDSKHTYYVNGDIKIYDICVADNCATATKDGWKTILIGGLDAGGRGYYAIDVTTPTAPVLMWEIDPSKSGFQNLGYTYSEPIVTKRSGDQKWVVLFASGYNNIPDNDNFYDDTTFKPTQTEQLQFKTGNGAGYLYVVDAKTGTMLESIGTGQGDAEEPSGLGKISAYIANARVNNETTYIYGGDLNGNLWRFNIDAGKNTVVRLAQLKDANVNGKEQPITTRPVMGKVNNKRVIYVGTGKFLEPSDIDYSLFTKQSLYAIKDTAQDSDTGVVVSNPRTVAGFINQTMVAGEDGEGNQLADVRVSGTSSPVDLKTDLGWYVDFPDLGERQDVAAKLVQGTLIVPTRVPTGTSCQPAGYGWLNFLDYRTGAAVPVDGAIVSQRTNTPIEGITVISADGKIKVIGRGSGGGNIDFEPPIVGSLPGFKVQRSIWREIIDID